MMTHPSGSRRARGFALGAAVASGLLLLACDSPTAPRFPVDEPPTAFEVDVDGYGYGLYRVTLRGDTLLVERRPDFSLAPQFTTRVVPTRADWRAFWRAADDAGVRSWPHRCIDESVVDGGGYGVEITYAGGRVQSAGANSYPRANGHCDSLSYTDDFRTFTRAITQLIGRQFP